MPRYRSTLCETRNLRTGAVRYYIEKCGAFQRVDAREFFARYNLADDYECLHHNESRGVRRFYTTIVWSE